MANKSMWVYAIGIFDGGKLKYVTKLGEGRMAFWEEGENAKLFGLSTATEICKGLNMNFIPAVVIKAPSYMELKNQ